MSSKKSILTEPSIGISNNGRDNARGDLIVAVDDVFLDSSNDQYVVKKLLGYGQFGQVFEVEYQQRGNSSISQRYAMKVSRSLSDYYFSSKKEAEILKQVCDFSRMNNMRVFQITNAQLARVSNINDPVVSIHKSFEFFNHHCIILELLNINILDAITARNYVGFPLHIVREIYRDILKGLVLLESCGVVHADIKPENILFTFQKSPVVKLIDFGISRYVAQIPTFYMQTRFYRAPEVVLELDYDTKIDVWASACVAVEIFLGMPIFPAYNEYHLIYLIEEMLGPFPDIMINRTSRKNEFFNSNNRSYDLDYITHKWNIPQDRVHKYYIYKYIDDLIMHYINPSDDLSSDYDQMKVDFCDLIKKILVVNPNERYSAMQALSHSFFN